MTPTLSRRMDVKNRLPRFIRKLVDYIMRYALDMEGIFRISIAQEPLGQLGVLLGSLKHQLIFFFLIQKNLFERLIVETTSIFLLHVEVFSVSIFWGFHNKFPDIRSSF